MAEQQRNADDRVAAERYYAEYIRRRAAQGSTEAALREAINEKAERSRKLVSMAME